jgi:hypothetical protein
MIRRIAALLGAAALSVSFAAQSQEVVKIGQIEAQTGTLAT